MNRYLSLLIVALTLQSCLDYNFNNPFENPPSAPSLLLPVNGSPNQPTSPTLSWETSTGAESYTLQVSLNSAFSSINIYNENVGNITSKQISVLENPATYFWRVIASNNNGSSPPSTTRSFSTVSAGNKPAHPTQSSPSNGSPNESISPTLIWNASVGANSYSVRVSKGDNSFDGSSLVINENVGNNQNKQLSGLSNSTTYYWQVSATNEYGTSDWSTPVWSFSTEIAGTKPNIPTLDLPLDNSPDQSTTPTLKWNPSSGTKSYTLQVSTSASFSSNTYDKNVGNVLSQQITVLANSTKYYWRVNASNDYGTSDWSTPRSFTTVSAGTRPNIPTLDLPLDNSPDQSTMPTLKWNPSPGAKRYTLQVSTSASFSSTTYNNDVGNVLSQQITVLANSTKYYWRVNATNDYGTSDWSTPRSFTTVSAGTRPNIPTLSSPFDNAIDQPTSLSLSWNTSFGATSYTIQVSKVDNTFTGSSLVVNENVGNNQSKQLSGLINSTRYYWRVNASNDYGTSDWSTPIRSFTTESGVDPNNNMVNVEGGWFYMGSNDGNNDEKPIHRVYLNSFKIDKYEVTQAEYLKVMGVNPSNPKGDNLPVTDISWEDATEYARRVGKRLPTEAEWEYVAREGKLNHGYIYSGSNNIDEVAWYISTTDLDGKIRPVGTKKPNSLGVFDMTGNAKEWCSDYYGIYSSIDQYYPTGPTSGAAHVIRGGSSGDNFENCRVSTRVSGGPKSHDELTGFRCVKD